MELLTRNNFEGWMQKILDRLDRQDELLLAIKTQGQQPPSLSEGIRLFDNQDLCLLLQISKRTLQRYRSEGALAYKTLGKKTYYSETDVLDFLSKHVKDFRQNDIEFYKARIRNLFNKYRPIKIFIRWNKRRKQAATRPHRDKENAGSHLMSTRKDTCKFPESRTASPCSSAKNCATDSTGWYAITESVG